jgi:site-specific DNA recombinase
MAALAEIYLDNLSDETAKGKRARAAAGLPNGNLPYGYLLSKQADVAHANNKATALVVPEEAEAVRLAFEWYATGHIGEAAIARRLNERGYRMRSKRLPATGLFTRDTVRCMLHNRFYAGWVHQPDDEATSWQARAASGRYALGLHQPIITQEDYNRSQSARVERSGGPEGKRRGTAPKRYRAAYLASGILRCKQCGQRMHGQMAGTGRAGYFCTWGYRGGTCAAKRKSIEAAVIDTSLGAAVAGLTLPDQWRAAALAESAHDAAREARRLDERAVLERKLTRLKELVIEGDISKDEYRAEKARVEAEITQVAPSAEHVDRERAAALMIDLRRLWQGATTEERRDLAGQAFEAVYLDLDTRAGLHFVLKEDLKPMAPLLTGCTGVTDGA